MRGFGWGWVAVQAVLLGVLVEGIQAAPDVVAPASSGTAEPVTETVVPLSAAAAVKYSAEGQAFSLMSYRLTPYVEPALILNLNGSATDGFSSYRGFTVGSHDISSQDTGNGSFDADLTYSRQRTDDGQDLRLKAPFLLKWKTQVLGNTSAFWPASTVSHSEDLFNHVESSYLAGVFPSYAHTWYRDGLQVGLQGDLDLSVKDSEWSWNFRSWTYDAAGKHEVTNFEDYTNFVEGNLSGHGEVRAGSGRRIETRWAWNALETERVLREHGTLLRPLSSDEEQQLAALLSKIGSEVSWDFREQRLHDTRVLWDFLVANGCVAANEPDAAVILSDTYLLGTASRLRGYEALVLAEVDAQATSNYWYYKYSNSSTYPSGPYLSIQEPAAGLGLLVAWSRPSSRAWQLDAVERLDYFPHRVRQEALNSYETKTRALSSALTLNLGYFPNERVSLTLSEELKLASAQLDHADLYGSWQDSYDDLAVHSFLSLAFNCKLAYAFAASLNVGWAYAADYRQKLSFPNMPTGVNVDAYNAYYNGQPYLASSGPSITASLNYRLF
jgi:hypothetical protein